MNDVRFVKMIEDSPDWSAENSHGVIPAGTILEVISDEDDYWICEILGDDSISFPVNYDEAYEIDVDEVLQ